MWDTWRSDEIAREVLAPPSPREAELLRFLAERAAGDRRPSLRRRLAGAFVGLGLRLDPEAITLSPTARWGAVHAPD